MPAIRSSRRRAPPARSSTTRRGRDRRLAAGDVRVLAAERSLFALGPTIVKVTATDAAGNAASGKLHGHGRRHDGAGADGAGGHLGRGDEPGGHGRDVRGAGDRRGRDAVTIRYSQEPGTAFALGTTTVTVTATDAAGNASAKSSA